MKDSEVSQVAHIEEDDQSMKSMMMKLTRDPYMVNLEFTSHLRVSNFYR